MKPNQGLKDMKLASTMMTSKIKKEDPVELPMDELFFDKLHDKIMAEVEKTEIKPTNRWSKAWVFLESKARYYRPANNAKTLHVVKMGVVGVSLTLGLSLAMTSLKLFNMSSQSQLASNNKQMILQEALEHTQDWVEMAASVQNDSDFYADVINQRLSNNQGSDLQL